MLNGLNEYKKKSMLYSNSMDIALLIYQLAFITSSTTLGVFLALLFASNFVCKKRNEHDGGESDSDDEDTTVFEEMYQKEFDELEMKDIPDEDIINSFTCEAETPLGNVVMLYDSTEKCYNYYTDCRNIPVRFLDVVARKFVVNNDCRALYRLEKPTEDPNDSLDKEDSGEERNDSFYTWFVGMFSTNTENNSTDTNTEYDTETEAKTDSETESETESESESETEDNESGEENSVFAVYKKNKKTEKPKKKLIEKVMNKYHYVGNLLDYNNRETKQNSEALEISFSKFKEILKNKNE